MDAHEALEICRKCGAICCKLGGTDFTNEEKSKVLEKGHKDHFNEISDDHHELNCKGSVCSYLDKENSCSIHDVRPLLCRRWPVFTTIEHGKRITTFMECPLGKALKEQEISDLKEIADLLPDKFIEESIKHSKIPHYKVINKRLSKFKETII